MKKEKEEIVIDIPESVVNFIWRLDTECQSYKNIISYILTHDDMDVTTKRFQQYQNDYIDRLYAFDIAKNELEKKYVKSIGLQYKKWELKYYDNQIVITIKEEKE